MGKFFMFEAGYTIAYQVIHVELELYVFIITNILKNYPELLV